MAAFTKEEVSRIWLSFADLPPAKITAILSTYESALHYFTAFDAKMWELLPLGAYNALKKLHHRDALLMELETLHDLGVHIITEPPERFEVISDPPMILYTLGDETLLEAEKIISIVGTRRATAYGRLMAQSIAEELAKQGVVIANGFASGIDSEALQGALKANGKCIAFLGSGIGSIYPPENDALYHQILDKGGLIVSEYPPGIAPLGHHFPQRNRLISAVADGVLLIESKPDGSGGTITVGHATEQGKDVFVLPGPANSELYQMPHALIRDGARLVTCAKDIFADMGWEEKVGTAADVLLTPEQAQIMAVLNSQEASFDEIAEKTGQNPAKLNSGLTILELAGIIKKSAGRIYMKVKR